MYCIKGNTKKAIASVETRKRWHSLRTHLFNVVEELGEDMTLVYINLPYRIRGLAASRLSDLSLELRRRIAKITFDDTTVVNDVNSKGDLTLDLHYHNTHFEMELTQWLESNGTFEEHTTWEDVEALLQGVDGEEETAYMFIGCDTPHVEHHDRGKYGVDTVVYTPERFLGEMN